MGDDWDGAAATFDEDADHGLRDPSVRAAWADLLLPLRLLRPGGRLLLVEGRWTTGVGLSATECRDLVQQHGRSATVRQLGADSDLWGRGVDDERYLLISLSE